MKFFAKTLLTWKEPRFFVQRMYRRRDWLIKFSLVAGFTALMMVGFWADRQWGKGPGRKWSYLQGTAVAVLAGVVLVSFHEMPRLRRDVTINDDAINVWGQAGYLVTTGSFAWSKISAALLVGSEESGKPFGILFLRFTKNQRGGWDMAVGVPPEVEMERIATVLHGLGLPVALSGWEPGQEAATAPESAPALPPARPASGGGGLQVWPVPEPYGGRIQKNGMHLARVAAVLLPVAGLFLGGLGAIGYAFWYRKEIPIWDVAVIGLGGMAVMGVAVGLGVPVLNFVTGRSLRAVARSEIRNRPDALVNPDEPDAVFVEVLPREHWGAITTKTTECGFVWPDRRAGCLLFEGDNERWRLPAGGLVSCTVERASVTVGKDEESQSHRYVAVVGARLGDTPWERPLSPPQLEFGWPKNRDREAKSAALRDAILGALSNDGSGG
jgi:hypothetical protein